VVNLFGFASGYGSTEIEYTSWSNYHILSNATLKECKHIQVFINDYYMFRPSNCSSSGDTIPTSVLNYKVFYLTYGPIFTIIDIYYMC
jgi:hypothetical protein